MARLHKPKAGFWIRLCVVLIYPVIGAFFRIRWNHLERVPSDGGIIMVANHTSQVDTLIMARVVWQSGRIPRFMIKAGVFGWPIIGAMMRGAAQIPVHRGTSDAAQSLRDAVAALERGEAVIIYPEGTTTKDPANWPMVGKTGVARLVLLRPETPVVPIGQWGAQRYRTLSLSRLGRRRTSRVEVGEPLDFTRFTGVASSNDVLREITDEIMSAVRDQVAQIRGETPPTQFFVPTRTYVDRRASR